MKREDVIQFLIFRKNFTKKEWFELNRIIDMVLKEKADKLELDDLDIEKIKLMLSDVTQ